ncbi:tetratricopeptide repeat protein [uncultured Treponema sp.]|uniref:tetratricopeptide repeat protein n=1 Tax=uncultured Treponema sp. TaxID=162155 RepID=UPI002636CBAD|nr:tetratricopeptide repeat protein [uncultured Treponema sp.]
MKKNKVLKNLFLCFFVATGGACFSFSKDSVLFKKIDSAYSGADYPAVIEYSSRLQKEFSSSPFLEKTLLYKGESFFYLGRFEDSIQTLNELSSAKKNETKIFANYWKGRSEFSLEDFSAALNSFYNASSISSDFNKKSKEINFIYKNSIYYAGLCSYSLRQYEKCIPVFESIISSNEYENDIFCSSLEILFNCYTNENEYSKLVKKYEELSPQNISCYWNISFAAGNAFEKLGRKKDAFACYEKIALNAELPLSVQALQKACYVYAEDFPLLLEKAKSALANENSLLSELWIRLGIDCFEKNDFESAQKYFSNAEQSDSEKKYSSLIGLYKAELASENKIAILDYYSTENFDKKYYAEYELAYAQQYAALGDFENSLVHAKNAYEKSSSEKKQLKQKSFYYYCLGLYSTGKSKQAISIIEKSKDNAELENKYFFEQKILYARCLAENGRLELAEKIYKNFFENSKLNNEQKYDYAKILFSLGNMSECKNVADSSSVSDAVYISALASFNMQDWKNSSAGFFKFIAENLKSSKISFAEFYYGYSLYKMGESSEAFNALKNFSEKYPKSSLCYSSCIVSANSALKNFDFENALVQASKALNFFSSQEEKENAVLLCASIYSDSEKYQDAVKFLEPYAKGTSEFSICCRYQIAVLNSRLGKISEADNFFLEIQNKFYNSPFADESSFRRADLYYNSKNYETAAMHFSEYQRKFPKGKFIDASYYYSADSYRKLAQIEKSILQYKILVENFPKSTFAYNARKNLSEIFEEQEKYEDALEQQKVILTIADSEEQRKTAEQKISFLKNLISGENSELALLEKRYAENFKNTTLEGRIAGTELAEFLMQNEQPKKDVFELADSLFKIQSSEKNQAAENSYAARTAFVCARCLRFQNKNKEAAQRFLVCAEFARKSGNDELAQRAIYGAAESFDAAKLYADSEKSAKTLLELYPKSSYKSAAQKFIKNN